MTRAVPFTQARLCRAIQAVRKTGLRVKAIRPDGTIIVDEQSAESNPQAIESVEEEQKVRNTARSSGICGLGKVPPHESGLHSARQNSTLWRRRSRWAALRYQAEA
jgi:hypothetical protein